jgi:hypothetical protein
LRAKGLTTENATSVAQFDSWWADLASGDSAIAYLAFWRFALAGKEAVKFLGRHLQPSVAVDPKRLAKLIGDLGHNSYAVRIKAAQEIENLEDLAEPALQRALAEKPSAEVRRQIQGLLEKMDATKSPVRMRKIWAVTALEHMESPEAMDLLQKLVGGAPEARLTQQAKESLARMQ